VLAVVSNGDGPVAFSDLYRWHDCINGSKWSTKRVKDQLSRGEACSSNAAPKQQSRIVLVVRT
jgi:hypothetical protein